MEGPDWHLLAPNLTDKTSGITSCNWSTLEKGWIWTADEEGNNACHPPGERERERGWTGVGWKRSLVYTVEDHVSNRALESVSGAVQRVSHLSNRPGARKSVVPRCRICIRNEMDIVRKPKYKISPVSERGRLFTSCKSWIVISHKNFNIWMRPDERRGIVGIQFLVSNNYSQKLRIGVSQLNICNKEITTCVIRRWIQTFTSRIDISDLSGEK